MSKETSDTEIYYINRMEMLKLCMSEEPATISISDPRLQVGWVNFRTRGGNIEMVLAVYNEQTRQDIINEILEKLPEYKENLTPYAEENSSKTLDKLIEQSEIVGYNQCLQEVKKLLEKQDGK